MYMPLVLFELAAGLVYGKVIISFVPGMGSLSAMESKGGAQRYFR